MKPKSEILFILKRLSNVIASLLPADSEKVSSIWNKEKSKVIQGGLDWDSQVI